MRFCACIDTLFTEIPFYDRLQAAKAAGFESVEFWNRDDKDPVRLRAAAEKAGIAISGFNGDAAYSLVDPSHKKPYLEYLAGSLSFAEKSGAESVTIHSNALGDGGVVVNHYVGVSDTIKLCSMYDMLLDCARMADRSGIRMNLEALNVSTDHVGNFLQTTRMGAEITRMIGCDRLKILFDAYHMQLNEGSLCDNLTTWFDQIGHIHVADAPGRHEPGTGEINFGSVFRCLRTLGYDRRIGFELFPARDTQTAVAAIMALKEA